MDKGTEFDRRDSVTLKLNAKHEYTFNAIIYYDQPEDIDDVIDRLMAIDTKIHENFINKEIREVN